MWLKMPLLCVLMLYLVACASVPASQPSAMAQAKPPVNMHNTQDVRSRLMAAYGQWKGVPHRDGGLSKMGVDCSGLVYLTFADVFGVRVPRSTEYQSQKGVVVELSELTPGDLVFFDTGIKKRHVGIYLGRKQFMHASSSRGVMISRLDNPYWKDAYWHSRRLVR